MPTDDGWKSIVASSLDWEQAHLKLQNAVKDLPAELRGQRPRGLPHSPWEIVEHLRRGQHDLLDFCTNPDYKESKWPDDYWPPTPAPPDDKAWNATLAQIRRDCEGLKKLTLDPGKDLTAKIPHGMGQTYLRTILVAVDHAAYHIGELVTVRRLLGAWPEAK
jgi:uncharacterized damage-inducible protein DinB